MTFSTKLPGEHEVLRQLVVDGIDDEGRGRATLGHGDSPVEAAIDIAIRGALPGDVVDARVERVFAARGLVQAKRLGPANGPLHVVRDCPHPGPCAACPLHGVDDAFVAALKQQRVRQAFVDVGLDVPVGPVVDGDGVRQKVKLVAGGEAGALVLGHYAPHSHVVVEAGGCAHARDDILIAVQAVRELLDEHELGPDLVVAVIARAFAEGVAVVVVANGPCPVDIDVLWPRSIPLVDKNDAGDEIDNGEHVVVTGVAWRQQSSTGSKNAIVGGDIDVVAGSVVGHALDDRARLGEPVHVDSFCQADALGASLLVEQAVRFVLDGVDVHAPVLDLYAGTGAFARVLHAHGARNIVAVESFPASVVALSALPDTIGIGGRVEDVIDDVLARGPVAGVVDPPRKGLGSVAAALASSTTLRRLAVVSCDVDAGARDVKALVDGGFVVDTVVPVDLFPGSAEVEVLTLLRRAAPAVGGIAGVDDKRPRAR